MLSFLTRLFSTDAPPVVTAQDTRIAAYALLIAIAEVDGEVAPEERTRILALLQAEHDLTSAQALAVLEEAQVVWDASIDLWQLTNQLNTHCSKDERLKIVEMMWQVVYADGRFDDHEHHMMSRIPALLNLEHGQVIDLKLKVRDGQAD